MPEFPKVYTQFNPTKIIAADTAVNQLQFGGADSAVEGSSPDASVGRSYNLRDPIVPSPTGKSDQRVTLLVKVVKGIFQFCVAGDPSSNPLTSILNDVFSITVHNRVSNLHFKAGAVGDEFTVSA